MTAKKGKIGSSFDEFLAEEGILGSCEEQAIKHILADQIKAAMETDRLTKSAIADAATGCGSGGTPTPLRVGVRIRSVRKR